MTRSWRGAAGDFIHNPALPASHRRNPTLEYDQERGSDKYCSATRFKCVIASTRKALNWRAVFPSYCGYLWAERPSGSNSPTQETRITQKWRGLSLDVGVSRGCVNPALQSQTVERTARNGIASGLTLISTHKLTPVFHRTDELFCRYRGLKLTITKPLEIRGSLRGSHCGLMMSIRLLTSHRVEPGSIPGRVTPDFRMWKSCMAMPLVDGFSRGYPVSPALALRRCSIHISINLTGSQELAFTSCPNLLTYLNSYKFQTGGVERSVEIWAALNTEVLRADEANRNALAMETGDHREDPLTSSIVRHDSNMRKSGSDPAGIRIRLA
ncbi:hypothetical protein PR048_019696 [Dryococelus australis]|uniref:Uncharacterized protein n=1 Tax=Dryococelus australis TaxID=614101 RepID=A0ABQ9H462_9NEOP|nr:hypothetical protein PR048_019696 [Dryococelus australis]